MVWMFFGLLPACAGQLFDREHVRPGSGVQKVGQFEPVG